MEAMEAKKKSIMDQLPPYNDVIFLDLTEEQ
jgi:hypothetical protein